MSSTVVRRSNSSLRSALRLALLFAAIKLLLQFTLTLWTQHIGYSYFRDEFYYIACGRHLAWGFVDHGPIVALQARLGELLFGDSLFAIRILSALAGAATVFLTGLLAWALGGRRPAQALAMIGVLVALIYIAMDGFLSMNSFEPVFWMLCALALIRLIDGAPQPFWWTVFGLSAGIGLLNKPSILFFLIAAGMGLLLTQQRRILFTRWAAVGIALIIVIALPYVLWQIHNHWPTLEFFHNGKVGNKNVILGPMGFFNAQLGQMHPLNALLWITGLISLLRARSIPHGRWIGLTFLIFYVLMFVLHAKDYYLVPIYPVLFAAGAIAWERRFATKPLVAANRVFAFPVFESALILTGLLNLPMVSPILRPAAWVRYTTAPNLKSNKTLTAPSGELPQFYADRFGWQQQVAIVARAFNSLSPADQRRVCIFGSNYGDAGAIDFFNRRDHLHLPPALSGHNNYWLWGMHGCDPDLVIAVIGDSPDDVSKKYESVTIVGVRDTPYAMPFEHGNIYLLRGRRPSAPLNWADERHYD
ncbi:MAG TPA: glycosyltransferase family 39 protein [Edaphobacter sp.]